MIVAILSTLDTAGKNAFMLSALIEPQRGLGDAQ
jgi:hypothetical protein